jgi:hypothetical protein
MVLQLVPEETDPYASLRVPVGLAISNEVIDEGSTPLFTGAVSLQRDNLKFMLLNFCTGLVTVSTYL